MVEVAESAKCPEHPERDAVATCARCGRFVCETCASREDELECRACRILQFDLLSRRTREPLEIGAAIDLAWKVLLARLGPILTITVLATVVRSAVAVIDARHSGHPPAEGFTDLEFTLFALVAPLTFLGTVIVVGPLLSLGPIRYVRFMLATVVHAALPALAIAIFKASNRSLTFLVPAALAVSLVLDLPRWFSFRRTASTRSPLESPAKAKPGCASADRALRHRPRSELVAQCGRRSRIRCHRRSTQPRRSFLQMACSDHGVGHRNFRRVPGGLRNGPPRSHMVGSARVSRPERA